MNIIAVDDEDLVLAALKEAICEALPNERPACFRSGEEALEYAEKMPVDVAFLDIKMSGMSGLALARALCALRPSTNIIFVTGHSEYLEEAFAQYASGYVKKPVRAKRIQKEIANLRHPPDENGTTKRVKMLGPYMFDHLTQRVYCNGRDTLLKPREYHLFCLFAGSPGTLFSPEELYRKIWGEEPTSSVNNTIRVHLSSLRKKLDMREGETPVIKKQRGVGYYLETEPQSLL